MNRCRDCGVVLDDEQPCPHCDPPVDAYAPPEPPDVQPTTEAPHVAGIAAARAAREAAKPLPHETPRTEHLPTKGTP